MTDRVVELRDTILEVLSRFGWMWVITLGVGFALVVTGVVFDNSSLATVAGTVLGVGAGGLLTVIGLRELFRVPSVDDGDPNRMVVTGTGERMTFREWRDRHPEAYRRYLETKGR